MQISLHTELCNIKVYYNITPVPLTGNVLATTTSASVRPAVDNVDATIEDVNQVRLAVLTFIPLPALVGST